MRHLKFAAGFVFIALGIGIPSVGNLFADSLILQGSVIPVADDFAYNGPAVGSFSPAKNQFFVSWVHQIDDGTGYGLHGNVLGRLIEPNGNLGLTRNYSFPLRGSSMDLDLSLGYNRILNNYLLVWTGKGKGKDGTFTRIVPGDATLGQRNFIASNGGIHDHDLTFSSFTNQYLLAGNGLELQLLDLQGRRIGVASSFSHGGYLVRVFADPEQAGYFVIWQEESRIKFQHFSASGTSSGDATVLLNQPNMYLSWAVYHEGNRQFLVFSTNQGNEHGNVLIKSILIDRTGRPVRSVRNIGFNVQTSGGIAIAATTSGYLVAYKNEGTLFARLLNRDGFPIGKSINLGIPTEIRNETSYFLGQIVFSHALHKALILFDKSGLGFCNIYGRFIKTCTEC